MAIPRRYNGEVSASTPPVRRLLTACNPQFRMLSMRGGESASIRQQAHIKLPVACH
jgi:hypothetical protein